MTPSPHGRSPAPLGRSRAVAAVLVARGLVARGLVAPVLVAAVLVVSTATTAWADDGALAACMDGLPADTTMADPDWRTVVDLGHEFAVRLPAGHVLSAAGDGAWYVHGFLDGAPLVPDVAISFLAGVTLDDAIARGFGSAHAVDRIRLGPATSGARVEATYTAPDGAAYRQASYLATTEHGVLRFDRYEGFDWDAFDAVACSVHVVEVVE